MANRNFNRYQALEKEIKSLYLEVAIGAVGLPTLTKGLGVATIVRTGAGDYRITLDDKYTRLMYMDIIELNSSAQAITTALKAEDVNGAKTIDFFTKVAATPTEAANGSVLLIRIDLKNSSVGE